MLKLTKRQQEVLRLIHQAIVTTGAPPTRAEIAKELGFRSANAAEDHLRALAKKGMIELKSGTSRGIRINECAGEYLPELLNDTTALASSNTADFWEVPLVGRVAAGDPILAAENVEQEYALSPDTFVQKPDYLLRVRGESMREIGIMDGDLLAVQKASDARNGQVVVARLGEDVTVKRLNRKGERIQLMPENVNYQPIEVQQGQFFAIEGIAVGVIRPNVF